MSASLRRRILVSPGGEGAGSKFHPPILLCVFFSRPALKISSGSVPRPKNCDRGLPAIHIFTSSFLVTSVCVARTALAKNAQKKQPPSGYARSGGVRPTIFV
uniref:Uncharacterized protein n=1 Tax=Schistocephalus solidus TaxID=70667 RepID=A0A0X3P4I3_SCHSO